MKKIGLGVALAALLAPGVVSAEKNTGYVHYKKGTVLEIPDAGFDVKFNFQIQSRYSYESYDEQASRGLEDASNFDLRRARFVAKGNAMNKKVTFKLQNDFTGGGGDTLRDAWLQYNFDESSLRAGQMKVPFARQENTSSSNLQFVERSITNNFFDLGRNKGAMLHGSDDGLGWAVGVFNGNSDGEGRNGEGFDPNVLVAGTVHTTDGDYSRKTESYPGSEGSGWTAGVSGSYQQAEVGGVAFDEVRANADIGLRSGGMTAQGEFFFSSVDPDGGGSSIDDTGFYVQGGVFIGENCELAARFAAVFGDSDASDADVFEYSGSYNHYLQGHALKVQAGITYLQIDPDSGSDLNDLFIDLQFGAYI